MPTYLDILKKRKVINIRHIYYVFTYNLESINKDKMFKKSYPIDYLCMLFHKSGDSK